MDRAALLLLTSLVKRDLNFTMGKILDLKIKWGVGWGGDRERTSTPLLSVKVACVMALCGGSLTDCEPLRLIYCQC